VNQYRIETNVTISNGVQKVYKFPNGYGASVIKHNYSYGGREGLWELAVLDKDGNLTYETPITSDVIGWLTDEEVDGVLSQINGLPSEEPSEGDKLLAAIAPVSYAPNILSNKELWLDEVFDI
jgi:hypothetical protein